MSNFLESEMLSAFRPTGGASNRRVKGDSAVSQSNRPIQDWWLTFTEEADAAPNEGHCKEDP